MKKGIIICTLLLVFGASNLNAQTKTTITKKEAKEVAKTINNSIDIMAKSIDEMDFDQLSNLINQTVDILDKNTDAIVTIVKKVDTEKLQKTAEKMAEKLDQNIDVEKLEKRLDEVSQKLEKALTEKK